MRASDRPIAKKLLTLLLRQAKASTMRSIYERITPDAAGVIRSVMSPGGTECVAGDTLILTSAGPQEIAKIHHTTKVWDGSQCVLPKRRVMYENVEGKEVILDYGFSLKGSLNHPVMTRRGWVPLSELTFEDDVLVQIGQNLWGCIAPLPKWEPLKGAHKHISPPRKVTGDLAELAGMWLADGTLHTNGGSYSIRLSNNDRSVLHRFLDLGAQVFGVQGSIVRSSDRVDTAHISSREAVEFFRMLGLDGHAREKEIPGVFMRANKACVRRLLRGLTLDTHFLEEKGSLAYGTQSPKLQQQLQVLLANMGILSSRMTGPNCMRLVINRTYLADFLRLVGFVQEEKAVQVARALNKISPEFEQQKEYWLAVKEIRPWRGDVYDVTMPDTSPPQYVANSILVHNTGRFSHSETFLEPSTNLANLPKKTAIGEPLFAVRDVIIPHEGRVLWKADYCFVGETLVDSPSGAKPIRDIRPGDLVYVFDHTTEKVTVAKVSEQLCVGWEPIVEVEIDSTHRVFCTPEHKFLVRRIKGNNRGGNIKRRIIQWVKAKDLKEGDKLVPFHKQLSPQGYEHVYAFSAFNYAKTHIEVARLWYGPRPESYHIHHKDGDKLNNSPNNLVYVSVPQHFKHEHQPFANVDEEKRLYELRISCKGKSNRERKRKKKESQTIIACQLGITGPRKVTGVVSKGILRPVYSIGVDHRSHNYALACGVFVGNSQAEARWCAWMAQDPVRMRIYAENIDHYRYFVALLKWDDETRWPEVSKAERNAIGKVGVLSGQYGVSWKTLMDNVNKDFELHGVSCDARTARKMVDIWPQVFKKTVEWWQEVREEVLTKGYLVNPFGRRRDFFARRDGESAEAALVREAIAYGPQSANADCLNHALRTLYEEHDPHDLRILLQVHDEIVGDCRPQDVMKVARIVKTVMQKPVLVKGQALTIPAEFSSSSVSWSSSTEIKAAA